MKNIENECGFMNFNCVVGVTGTYEEEGGSKGHLTLTRGWWNSAELSALVLKRGAVTMMDVVAERSCLRAATPGTLCHDA